VAKGDGPVAKSASATSSVASWPDRPASPRASAPRRSLGSPRYSGSTPAKARDVLARTGLLAQLGQENVLPSDPHIGSSLGAGMHRGREVQAELNARTRPADEAT